MRRELIVFVPGLARVTRATELSNYVDGLKAASERMLLEDVTDDTVPRGARRLRGKRDGHEVEIDVQEAYWNDLVPSLTQEPLKTRVVRGLTLFGFWAFSGAMWKGARGTKYLTFGMALSAFAVIVWYLATLSLLIEAFLNAPPAGLERAVPAASGIASWWIWLGVSAVVAALPIALLVDMADFAKRYVAEESSARGRPAVRFEIVKHVRDQFLAAMEHDDYDTVTLVGHSFGTVIVVDLMADLPPPGRPIRVVTLGSPIEILSRKAPWLKDEVRALAERTDLVEWVDVDSRADWFASGAGIPKSERCREVLVRPAGTFLDKMAARVHSRYFDNQGAVQVTLRMEA